MNITGILAEYDPLHSGHIYHLSQAKEDADGIVVLLSGHLTQRGSFAKYDKWSRARAALLAGADLVLELSSSFCCASAERFASAAVSVFDRMGVVSRLSFGSESGDIFAIQKVASLLDGLEGTVNFEREIKRGASYPKARQTALGEAGELLCYPNNTLAVEYCKAIRRQQAKLSPHTVKRVGATHNSFRTDVTVSSSYLREHEGEMARYLKKPILDCFTTPSRPPEILFLSQLRRYSVADFAELPDVSNGLEHRLWRAAQNACSLDDFYSIAKTKCVTHSRLRRISVYALLGIRKSDLLPVPPYACVLGFTPVGRQILRMTNADSLVLSPNFAEIAKRFPKEAGWDALATDFFYLGTNPIKKGGENYRRPPIQTSSETEG